MNFFWRREVIQNGLLCAIGKDYDVYRENGRWRFRYGKKQGDILQEKIFVLGLLVVSRVISIDDCDWEAPVIQLRKTAGG